jgi:hypothetical protein
LAKVLDGGGSRFRTGNFQNPAFRNPNFPREAWFQPPDPNAPFLNDSTLLGSINRKVDNQNFQGGRVSAILGSIEIDLSRSRMADGRNNVTIDTHAILGAIKLRIPEYWRVVWNGENVLGNFEDKSIPPTTGSNAPQLILTGSCVMGTIEIDC